MADEIKINRPASMPSPSVMPVNEPQGSGGSKTPWIILGIVIVVIILLGVLFRGKLFSGAGKKTEQSKQVSKPSGFQAVFMSNGQVYFGKLTNEEGQYATLADIFYLQVVQPPLQGQQQPGEQQPAQPQPQISLVKLGNELHGPVDEMKINRDHILFYEDLKSGGQVAQAINNYKANPPAATPPPAK